MSSFRGKVVLVNFWTTTCAICLREMPKIAETHERYRARIGDHCRGHVLRPAGLGKDSESAIE